MTPLIVAAALIAGFIAAPAAANPARDAIVAGFKAEAQAADSGFAGFSADRGRAIFENPHTGGEPEIPSCTTCHGKTPFGSGETRTGKKIDPMAVSKNPERYTDPEKVAKWFRRNCNTVLGRECTPQEKGDYLTFMMSQ
ncbi:MAG: DUF1924 domain-containing protein [Rhodospirillaceae bacterium]|nr:DUF1924 domain-containing protein [Rhodospirillaceae bacterium]